MTRRCAEKDKCIQSIKIERHTHQDFWGVYALCLKISSVFSIIVVFLLMQVGDSPAHRNSSGSGNYEGNGAISEVMGLALHTGLAPAFLCCTITQYLVLFYLPLVSWIPGPCILDLTLLSCVVQLLNTLNCILDWTLLSSPILYTSFTGEISSEIDRSSLCDIEKSSFKCFEIGLKMILPTQVHTQRITKTLLVHLPDL